MRPIFSAFSKLAPQFRPISKIRCRDATMKRKSCTLWQVKLSALHINLLNFSRLDRQPFKASPPIIIHCILLSALSIGACNVTNSQKSPASTGATISMNFDSWYKSFIRHRDYKSCTRDLALLDPSLNERSDWAAGERRFFVAMPVIDPIILADMSPTAYVPGLESCNVAPGYPHPRDIGNLTENSPQPQTAEARACSHAAMNYLAAYNKARAMRHPAATAELCSNR